MSGDAIIGWDVGGAHLKAARLGPGGVVEAVVQVPCPLWQGMEHLYQAVAQARGEVGEAPRHAVTMTGEMVDLFPSRADGVARLAHAMDEQLPGASVRFFGAESGFVDCAAAATIPNQIASANWLASAAVVAATQGTGLFVDVGSTTADLVPVRDGEVGARGHDDAERLVTGELVYTGVVRTPVMAMAERVPVAGHWVPLIPEYFATAADVHRLTGDLPDCADQHPTADGGPKTVEASARRLARMIGRDLEGADLSLWQALAHWLSEAQLRRLADAADLLLSIGMLPPGTPVVGAGVGRFLAARLAAARGVKFIAFAELIGAPAQLADAVSNCAPAVAVGWLGGRSEG
ncbi:MAG TPA: hydantoinase/oxoprolinase family protein [Gemmatimonadales bacterium]|nr:hydantoinase/oxoprolinase family protein [Gemmatimonadales bacterium]